MQTGHIGERDSKLEQFLGKWSLEQMLVGEIVQFLYIKLSVNFQPIYIDVPLSILGQCLAGWRVQCQWGWRFGAPLLGVGFSSRFVFESSRMTVIPLKPPECTPPPHFLENLSLVLLVLVDFLQFPRHTIEKGTSPLCDIIRHLYQ